MMSGAPVIIFLSGYDFWPLRGIDDVDFLCECVVANLRNTGNWHQDVAVVDARIPFYDSGGWGAAIFRLLISSILGFLVFGGSASIWGSLNSFS